LVQKAADQGWKNALIDLASLYARGIGEPRNESESPFKLLLRVHQWDDLLQRYYEGRGTQRDLMAAAECYCRLAVLYPRHYSLADKIEFHAERPASDRDYFKASDDLRHALSPYLKSARHDASAALQIAARYMAGIDGPKSSTQAWAWLTIAKQMGSSEAEAKIQKLESQMSHEELSRANEQFEEHARALRHVQDFVR
jgi:TPR repeat protein